ncbi:MAG: nucleoside deaminase [Candidatus Thermoplasmatota archaeon]|nr:nucleoside deaminase [Candidatus Thermoplasmatota archaeon]
MRKSAGAAVKKKSAPPEKKYMRIAIKEATANVKACAGGPFGACIIKDGKVISKARNTVLSENDSTCHAEINAIREACRKLGTFDLFGCMIYSTTEPCPMCFSAIHWARIDAIVYGTKIANVEKLGFNEMSISNTTMKRLCKSRVAIIPGFLQGECLALIKNWKKCNGSSTY